MTIETVIENSNRLCPGIKRLAGGAVVVYVMMAMEAGRSKNRSRALRNLTK